MLIVMGAAWPQAPWWLVMGVPLVIMLLYWGWGHSRDPNRIVKDVLGDSLYFLGFLFTLASLVSSLIGLLTAPDQEIAASHLLGRFGVALSTTMLGFYLRTVLGQLTPRLDQEEREVQAQIHRYVVELSQEMTASVATLKEARRVAEDSLKDATDALTDGLQKALNDAGEQISKTLRNSLGDIVAEYGKSAETITQSTAASAETIRTSMQTATDRLSAAIGDLEKRIRDFEPPQQHVHTKLDDLFTGLGDNIGDLDVKVKDIAASLASTLEEFQEFTKSVNGSNRQMARASRSLTTLADATETGATAMDKGAAAFAGLDEAMADAASGLATLVERVSAVSEDLAGRQAKAAEARAAEAEAWASHLEGVSEETARARAKLAEAAARDLSEWEKDADAARRQAAVARDELTERLEQATRLYAEKLASVSAEDTRMAREQLVAHVRRMAEDFGEAIRRMDEELHTLVAEYKALRARRWDTGEEGAAGHG